MSTVKVKDQEYLVRNKTTGAIINTDTNGFNAFVRAKQRSENLDQRLDRIEETMEMLLQLLKNK